MRLSIAAAMTCAAALAAQDAARAQTTFPDDGVEQTTISVADVDVTRAAGADVALKRIQRAADRVCGPQPLGVELAKVQWRRQCVRSATANGVVQLTRIAQARRMINAAPTELAQK